MQLATIPHATRGGQAQAKLDRTCSSREGNTFPPQQRACVAIHTRHTNVAQKAHILEPSQSLQHLYEPWQPSSSPSVACSKVSSPSKPHHFPQNDTLSEYLAVSVLLVNAIAILSEDRFLARIGWGNAQQSEPSFGGGGMQDNTSVKAKMINLINSVRTLMRSMHIQILPREEE